jgi:hypothetical protein
MVRHWAIFFLAFLSFYQFPSFGICSIYEAEGITISCDRWPDSTSLERFGNDSIRITGARTHEEKAIAVWRYIQHLTAATSTVPKEPSLGNNYVIDPLKLLNVYGGHWCDGLSRIMEMTWRALGYRAQKLYNFGHTLADCHWKDSDGIERWHVFDVSQHWYVYDRSGGHIATKDELSLDPSLIYFPSHTPIPSNPSLMQPSYVHAGHLNIEPHSMGINLRIGEAMERYWGNERKPYYNLFGKEKRKDFKHGPYPVTYGNGRLVYQPDLSKQAFKQGLFQEATNLSCTEEDGLGPALHPSKTKENGIVIFGISLPYVISDAWLDARVIRDNLGDEIRFSISIDGGHTWRTFWEPGNELGIINLEKVNFCIPFNPDQQGPPKIITPFGRYDYLFKIEMKATEKITSCGLESFSLVTVFQHNLFSLPMLWPGRNKITVRGDLNPKSMLKLTYVWEDPKGRGKTHIEKITTTPFQFEIVTRGNKWEDIICRSIKIEVLPRDRNIEISSILKGDPNAAPHPSITSIPQVENLIGSYRPERLKNSSYYIKRIEAELKMLNHPSISNDVLKRHYGEIRQNVLALGALKDPRSKEVLELIIAKDRTHAFQNKVWACQALFQSVGHLAAPMMLRILDRDRTITWHDPENHWSQDAMWLHTVGIASAILANIREFKGKEQAADLIAEILRRETISTDPKKIWYGEEVCWGLIKSLGKLGDKKHIGLIRTFLKEDSDARTMALQALGDIGDSSVTRDVLAVLKSFQYSPNGLHAIETLGKIGTKEVGPDLYPILSHWDEDFRVAAAVALGKIGDFNAIPRLKKMIENETFLWVIDSAKESLRRLEKANN